MHNQEKDKVAVLFSGGKDSSLAAFILSRIFKIELITISFGILENWKQAEKAAKILKLPFTLFKMDEKIIKEAARITIKDGYPNNSIKYIHKSVLEKISEKEKIIADGVRRQDWVPVLSLSEIESFEAKFGAHYLQPLMGYSKKTINLLLEKYFLFTEYKGDSFPGAEYEFELREFIKKNYYSLRADELFPKNHTHSIITSFKSP